MKIKEAIAERLDHTVLVWHWDERVATLRYCVRQLQIGALTTEGWAGEEGTGGKGRGGGGEGVRLACFVCVEDERESPAHEWTLDWTFVSAQILKR
jgi:hypothetical protein